MNDMIRSLLEEQDFIPKSGFELSTVFCSVVRRAGPVVSHRDLYDRYSAPVSKRVYCSLCGLSHFTDFGLSKTVLKQEKLQQPLCNILNQEFMASVSR